MRATYSCPYACTHSHMMQYRRLKMRHLRDISIYTHTRRQRQSVIPPSLSYSRSGAHNRHKSRCSRTSDNGGNRNDGYLLQKSPHRATSLWEKHTHSCTEARRRIVHDAASHRQLPARMPSHLWCTTSQHAAAVTQSPRSSPSDRHRRWHAMQT